MEASNILGMKKTLDEEIENEDKEEENENGSVEEDEKKKSDYMMSKRKGPSRSGRFSTPFCQAESCEVDLTFAKRYHRRHKVCEVHSKVPYVVVAGLKQRFCQQCSRFHELIEFDESKRSCRRRLARHNERRRRGNAGDCNKGSNNDISGQEINDGDWRKIHMNMTSSSSHEFFNFS